MTEKYQVYIVPHTHWDREWYGSFQLFRLRLVRLMNRLIDLLERDPAYTTFNLDGQTIILEDYLEVRPEQRATLQRLIADGRLFVGPWYILPDEFLSGGESIVRNLLLGAAMSDEFGRRMNVGYIPDTFGHIAQLPQILNGFGLDTCMNFRGLDSGGRKSELWWQSPDGSRVLLHHMSTDIGYSDLGALADNPQRAAYDLHAAAQYKAERATGNVLLVMQGVDHAEAREDLPQIIDIANDTFPDMTFKQASLEDFWDAIKQSVTDKSLDTVHGELRDVPRTAPAVNYLLYNVLSSRMDNKLLNARTLINLEHWAEPWATVAWLWHIADYPAGHLWTAWKWLLKNHPHDSIGGCSVDEVHRQMNTRFEWAEEIARYLTEERFRLIAQQVNHATAVDDEIAIMLFNASPWQREEIVTVDVDLPDFWLKQQALAAHQPAPEITPDSHYLAVRDANTRADWLYGMPDLPEVFFRGIHVRPADGEPVPVQIHDIQRTTHAIALASGPRGIQDIHRVTVSFPVTLPPLGYATYCVKTDANPVRWQPKHTPPPHVLRNEHLTVTVHPNGTFDLHHHATGHIYPSLGLFEDSGDNGDGYTFSPPRSNQTFNTHTAAPRISRVGTGVNVQQIRIEYDFALPVSLDDTRQRRRSETVTVPLTVDLILRDDADMLEINVEIDNRARDHRVRLRFPTGLHNITEASSAMQFDVMTRPIKPQPVAPDAWWVEDAPDTFPMHGWMSLHSDKAGLSVIAPGVHEFAVDADTEHGADIALTLLRAVGYLGARRDPSTIIGGAGPGIPTPEAQLQQKLSYRLALYPHAGTWADAAVHRRAHAIFTPPRTITTPPQSGELTPTRAGIRLEGENAILSTLKQAEDAQSTIVRLYNPTLKPTTAIITSPVPLSAATLTNLQETHTGDDLTITDKTAVRVTLPPKKIVTIRLMS